jgi:hypothetical protein
MPIDQFAHPVPKPEKFLTGSVIQQEAFPRILAKNPSFCRTAFDACVRAETCCVTLLCGMERSGNVGIF